MDKRNNTFWCKKNITLILSATILFCCALFAFVGPLFVPYGYDEQYRNSTQLSPLEYSPSEEIANSISSNCKAFYSTSLQSNSLNTLLPGFYHFKVDDQTYCFEINQAYTNSLIILSYRDMYDTIIIAEESNIKNSEVVLFDTIPHTNTISETSKEISMQTKVFPHYLGTDSLGRDLLSRTMCGTKVSFVVAFFATIIAIFIGTTYGAISGLLGGAIDNLMMRSLEIFSSVPDILIVLLLQVVFRDSLTINTSALNANLPWLSDTLSGGMISIFLVFALVYWIPSAKLIRGYVIQVKESEFVESSIALGASKSRVIFKHIIPHCTSIIIVAATNTLPSAIFLESFLSFLGLGISAPLVSLGSLCSDAITTLSISPFKMFFPSLVLTLIVFAFNLLGDYLRDHFDPRHQHQK